ncbi:uncharacterized protein [Nicotiana sylvestris]|uniref:uncharacterized protein n=1 Tax=Nicotiana sylvestris TaxID=4096 RepID=UPI00388C7A4B
MTNPQENLGTPPPPTPSNSSTPPPPSTSPKPRLRRVKMVARKTATSGARSKKLNEQLKASQAQDSDSSFDSESYKSSSEGEGPGSSDSEKTQESPSKVSASSSKSLENRFILVGSVRDVEIPKLQRSGGKKKFEKEKEREGEYGDVMRKGKGVVDHSPTVDLSVPAICGVEQENVEESGKKLEGSGSGEDAEGLVNLRAQGDELGSSTKETLADLLKKVGERATRSRVKQSESALQKALTESKKKMMDKRKGKVAESSEAVEVEEMEQVHQETATTMEVQTPKPKKPKTSSKKSTSVSKAAEPSLAKRIRSAVKSKQIAERPGGTRNDETGGCLSCSGWKDIALKMDGKLARKEIIEFIENAEVKDSRVSSLVKGVHVTFDAKELDEILDIPSEGFDDYTRQIWPCLDSLSTALAITMRYCDVADVGEKAYCKFYKLSPNGVAGNGSQINWTAFIIKLLDMVINGSKAHTIPYGFILTTVLDRCNVPLKK